MISEQEMVFRLFLAVLLSGFIGYERELHGRAAGLRTNILVGVGACLMMLTSAYIFDAYHAQANLDPARIPAQVISGIGFLGAGTILRFGASVRGLTTAAGIWAIAGIGLAVGAGFYSAAVFTTALMFVVLFSFTRWEWRLKRIEYHTVRISAEGGVEVLAEIRRALDAEQLAVRDWQVQVSPERTGFSVTMQLRSMRTGNAGQLPEMHLAHIAGVRSVEWV